MARSVKPWQTTFSILTYSFATSRVTTSSRQIASDSFCAASKLGLSVTTFESVISEAVYVLSSKDLYNLPRDEVKAGLMAIILLPGLRMNGKNIGIRGLELYAATRFDFVD